MKAIKRGQAVPPATKTTARSTRQEQITKVAGAQAAIEGLQHVLAELDRLPLPVGKLGCQFLDALELCDKIREKVRQKARELLLKEPGIIPHWHASETSQRVLSKNTLKVFIAAAHADNSLTAEEFITYCTTNLGALRRLLAERNPDWSPDEIEHVLNHALVDLISYDTVTRLSRSKDRQLNLSL
jgi:hypothetical protein